MKGKIAATLFGLPFLAVGAWMLVSIAGTLADAVAMRDWVAVPATLEDAGYRERLTDDSPTYEAYARYRYEFRGHSYTGTRVAISGGSDNIGSFQQDTGRWLADLLANGAGVTAWVDPREPTSAVLDRRVRWGLVAFKSVFVLAFGGAGAAILYFAWRRRPASAAGAGAPADAPWLANSEWQSPTLRSGSRQAMWGAWLFAVFWNAISAPLPFLAWQEIVEKDNKLALLALLFPLVGLGLLAWAIRRSLEWRRFGAAPLTLDPFPGAIGGDVGGTIEVGCGYDPGARYELTLTALRSYVSGSGKNRSRRERAEWQDSQLAWAEPHGDGTRLAFRFDVPDGLAESDARRDGDSWRLWRLNLRAELTGADLDRDYDIPVYRTAARAVALPARGLALAAERGTALGEERLLERFRVMRDAGGARVLFPAGRHAGGALAGLAVGGSFAAAGWFIATQGGSPLFGSVFGGIGALFALGCLYALTNSLEVFQDGTELVSLRRILGLPVRRRSLQRHTVRGFRRHSSMQTQSGSRHVMHVSLYASDAGGNEIIVGEGLRGESETAAAERYFARLFGLRIDAPAAGRDEDPLAADA